MAVQFTSAQRAQAQFIVWLKASHPDVYAKFAAPILSGTQKQLNGLGTLGGFADVIKSIVSGASSVVNSVVQNAPAIATAYSQTQAQLAAAQLIKTNAERAQQGLPPIDASGNTYSASYYDRASGMFGSVPVYVWGAGALLLGFLLFRRK